MRLRLCDLCKKSLTGDDLDSDCSVNFVSGTLVGFSKADEICECCFVAIREFAKKLDTKSVTIDDVDKAFDEQ